MSYNIPPSLSDWLHSVWRHLSPSRLLEILLERKIETAPQASTLRMITGWSASFSDQDCLPRPEAQGSSEEMPRRSKWRTRRGYSSLLSNSIERLNQESENTLRRKAWAQAAHWGVLPNAWSRVNTSASQTPKQQKRRWHSPAHPVAPVLSAHPNQTHPKKTTPLWIQIKNPPQDVSAPSPATYKKDYMLWPSGTYSRIRGWL